MGYLQKVGKAYARGGLRSCAAGAVGLVLGVGLLATTLWIAGGREASADSYRPLLALGVAPAFVVALLVGAWLFVWRRGVRLDRVFAGLGLRGHQVGGTTRGWHGEVGGRSFDAWFRKGPTLELYLGCRPATRGGLARTGELGQRIARGLTSRRPLAPSPPEAGGCTVYADDPQWMRSWLAAPGVEAALGRLLAETDRVWPMVTVTPNALYYMRRFIPQQELTAENLAEWLADLGRLAAAADAVGPSAAGESASQLDEWGRLRRGRRFLPWFFGCMGLVLLAAFGLIFTLVYRAHY